MNMLYKNCGISVEDYKIPDVRIVL